VIYSDNKNAVTWLTEPLLPIDPALKKITLDTRKLMTKRILNNQSIKIFHVYSHTRDNGTLKIQEKTKKMLNTYKDQWDMISLGNQIVDQGLTKTTARFTQEPNCSKDLWIRSDTYEQSQPRLIVLEFLLKLREDKFAVKLTLNALPTREKVFQSMKHMIEADKHKHTPMRKNTWKYGSPICILCEENSEETISHTLFDCEGIIKARDIHLRRVSNMKLKKMLEAAYAKIPGEYQQKARNSLLLKDTDNMDKEIMLEWIPKANLIWKSRCDKFHKKLELLLKLNNNL
jgi:hypothetical protein